MMVWLTLPLLAQKTPPSPRELNQKEFLELMNQFFGQGNTFFNQLSDSTFTQMPNGGFYRFYNFSDVDSLSESLPMKELEEWMEKNLGTMNPSLKTTPFGSMQPLDLQNFMQISPDSLAQQLKQFEHIWGDDIPKGKPDAPEEQKKEKKKKRKTYSL